MSNLPACPRCGHCRVMLSMLNAEILFCENCYCTPNHDVIAAITQREIKLEAALRRLIQWERVDQGPEEKADFDFARAVLEAK